MKLLVTLLASVVLAASALPARAADDSKVKLGAGKIGEGVEETAKGIGNTVVEGAKYSGDKLKESGKAAEPKAKSAWESVRDGTVDFGHSVKNFFTNLFGG